jgi:hypothetical protein
MIGRNFLISQGIAAGGDSRRAGDGARTHDSHVGNAEIADAKANDSKELRREADSVCTGFAPTRPNSLPAAPAPPPATDPDLAHVLDAWPTLPAHIKAAILALVATAR